MRAALGAQRSRLVRQLVTESLLLASLGGVFGLLLAQFGIRLLVSFSPPELLRTSAITLDSTAFVFAFGMTALVGLVLGIVPAVHASRTSPRVGMQQVSRTTVGGHSWVRRSLVVSEFALALVLLVSAGLLFRSLQRIFAIEPGFDSSHLLTMQVQESGHRFDDNAARDRFFTSALEAVRQVPGVKAAAFTSQLPLSGDYDTYGVEFEQFPNDSGPAFRYSVSPGYFETMRIPLVRGRFLQESDRAGAPLAIAVNESMAKRKFPGEDPIGKKLRVGPSIHRTDEPWGTIVGVVGDVKQLSLGIDQGDSIYTTTTQWAWVDSVQSLVVRAQGNAADLAPAVRKAIWSVDKDQPIVRVATMENLVAASESQRRFALVLFESFALVAIFLAATGMYGVMAGSVVERMREIGVRLAVGASRGNILSLVVRQAMVLAAVGVIIGMSGAAMASRAMIALLFGISPLDPVTYAAVVTMLLAVSAVACWVPAWRAARIDPAITLRGE
jgi:putative ABC transport system permease protein